MDQYKKMLQRRMLIFVIGMLGVLTLLALSQFGIITSFGDAHFANLLRGFQFGLLVTVEILFVRLIAHYIRALRNEESLKKAYFSENDERTKMIQEKTGGNIIVVCSIIILLAGIIGGYFNEIIFYALISCSVFLLIVRKAFKLYYTRKF